MTGNTPTLPITIDQARAMPLPHDDTHKHSRGRLAVISGGPFNTGAARLAARAGQRIGAGWVSLFGSRAACEILAHHETSILINEIDPKVTLARQLTTFDAVIIGPAFGLDDVSFEHVMKLISDYKGALVLDADALIHVGAKREAAFEMLRARQTPAILTPHTGEFTALFGTFDPIDKAAATLDAAKRAGCIIVHKGATTYLAGPKLEVFVNQSAAPFLATAGTGDVLAGMIGGLLAQGMSPTAACQAAIWLHGELGRTVGPGLIAEDLITHLPAILKDVLLS